MTKKTKEGSSETSWTYVKQWEDPQEKIEGMRKRYGKLTSSPVFFG